MARFLDFQAKDTLSVEGPSSEGELSEEISYGRQRHSRGRRLLSSESDDENDGEHITKSKNKRLDKENRRAKHQSQGCRSRSPSSERAQILSELKKTNKIMTQLTKKMNKHESRLQAIENKLSDSASSSSPFATPKRSLKKEVPVEVRRETRRVYNLLIEDISGNFDGWKIEPGITFKDPHNQNIVNVLIQEVKGLNPGFLTQHIKDAAYRFYRSRNEDQSSKRRGTFNGKGKAKRRHERLVRKLQDRKKILETGSYANDEEKEAWKKIMTVDFMSSDESGTEEDQDILLIKPLLWQSERVTYFKHTLDEAALKQKSPLARRQMKQRRKGMPSSRAKPSGDFPAWVFNEN